MPVTYTDVRTQKLEFQFLNIILISCVHMSYFSTCFYYTFIKTRISSETSSELL